MTSKRRLVSFVWADCHDMTWLLELESRVWYHVLISRDYFYSRMRSTLRNALYVKLSFHIIDVSHLDRTSFIIYQKHHTNLFQIYHSDSLLYSRKNNSERIEVLYINECVFRCLIKFKSLIISNLLINQILHRSNRSNSIFLSIVSIRHFEFVFQSIKMQKFRI